MPQPDLPALAGVEGEAAREEARRTLQICNACRYCEGFCAVFPAMTRRRAFPDADVVHLANLCHGCRDCFHACQYAPPHDFAINVPRALAEVRLASYRDSAPAPGFALARPGLCTALLLAVATALTEAVRRIFGGDPDGRGFYGVLGREAMIAFGTGVALIAALGLIAGMARYLRQTRGEARLTPSLADWAQAARHAVTLRYLGGNGAGCNDIDGSFGQRRRVFHHLMAGGFVLCFAATSVGAVYDHFLGWFAPYPWLSVPGVLGTAGGLGIVAGCTGLLLLKQREDPAPTLPAMTALDRMLLMLLLVVALTGLALRAIDAGAALPALVVVHLGSVAALFVALPIGKFLHAPLRFLALVKDAGERRGGTG